jgi:Zn-finger nucleic acid-binding protein
MQCPVDGNTLAMSNRQGVEIDYCPQCRGVWLDRGELDKLIEREASYSAGPAAAPTPAPAPAQYREERPRHRDDDDDDHYGHYGKKRKKKSFLSEMFEFGD